MGKKIREGFFCCFMTRLTTMLGRETQEPLPFQSKNMRERSTQSLNGKWALYNQNRTICIEATVPGQVQDALIESGHLHEPYFGLNYVDEKYRALIHNRWVYERTFTLAIDGQDRKPKVFLDCHGLDTLATIVINGETAETTDNQFRRYIINITLLVKPGENSIRILFDDATRGAQEAAKSYPYYVPDMFNMSDAQHGFPCRNFIRKEQCSFSWDWGPAFSPCGIWRPIELHVVDSFQVLQWDWQVIRSEQTLASYEILVTAHYVSLEKIKVGSSLSLQSLESPFTAPLLSESAHQISQGYGTLHFKLIVPSHEVKLWWPRGLGDQILYPATIQLTKIAENDGVSEIVFHETFCCGFRSCRLIQNEMAKGTGFWFEVNGVSFFAKGTNWIPVHAFDRLGTWKKKKFLLDSCKEANMNMIRIWGGGIYEEDAFYDYCDRNGILIWQEFMFACALYPTDDRFLENVRCEVNHQVKRLMGHPSLILWSGNNENQEFMVKGWDKATVENPYIFAVDYHKLYIETIRDAVLNLDKTRSFISSSPSAGLISETPYTERYVLKESERGLYGDVHFYDYRHNGRHVENYPNTRFASEYGAQSMPSFNLWRKFSSLKDWHPLSPLSIHRNHHGNGQQEIIQQVEMQFRLPRVLSVYYNANPREALPEVSSDVRETLMDVFCYLSQVVQAGSIGAQTEHYRRGQGSPFRTMGALYWQCNDIWPSPTWSSIEHHGKWKMLHHFIKRAFQDVLVSTVELPDHQGLEIHVSNTMKTDIKGTLTIRSYAMDGVELTLPNSCNKVSFQVGRQNSKCLLTLSHHALKTAVGDSKGDRHWQLVSISADFEEDRNKQLSYEVPAKNGSLQKAFHLYPSREPFPIELLSSETSIIIEDVKFQSLPQHPAHPRAYLNSSFGEEESEDTFVVEFIIQSTTIAGFVWLEWTRPPQGPSDTGTDEDDSSYGYFDDNGFWLLPLDKKVVRYHGRGRCTPPPKSSDISIKSLFDVLQSFDIQGIPAEKSA